jgi:hypothetical protein
MLSGGEVWGILRASAANPGSIEMSLALSVAGLVIFLLWISHGVSRKPRTKKRRRRLNRSSTGFAFAVLGALSIFLAYGLLHDIEPAQAAIETNFTIDISLNSPIAGLDTTPQRWSVSGHDMG